MVDRPLVVLVGPTASGKTALALRLAEAFAGEIVSCDSVAVYRGLEIGAAKPSDEERARIPHHLLDMFSPDQPCTAGDYSRLARAALAEITGRGKLPLVAGGTGLYLRALIDGLAPSPPRDEALRTRLRRRTSTHLHRLLGRLDPPSAAAIHPNDTPKLVRALEATLAGRRPLSRQWQQGRDGLTGYRILRLGLAPARELLYRRIDARAAAMFDRGLVEETAFLVERFGAECRPLTSLGYAEAAALLRGECTRADAIARAQQGHRHYAKRQGTWFRREPEMHWLPGFGEDEAVWREARRLVEELVPRGTSSTPV